MSGVSTTTAQDRGHTPSRLLNCLARLFVPARRVDPQRQREIVWRDFQGGYDAKIAKARKDHARVEPIRAERRREVNAALARAAHEARVAEVLRNGGGA